MTLVFRDYDLAALELEYAGSVREPHLVAPRAKREARVEVANAEVVEKRPRMLDFVYGIHERERLDYYPTVSPRAPLFVFFHGGYWKMRDKSRTPHGTLIRARRIAVANGLRHVYLGNVHDKGRSSTYCHACGERLIARDWYVLSDWRLDAAGDPRLRGLTAHLSAAPKLSVEKR